MNEHRETYEGIILELATGTQHTMREGELALYVRMLEKWDVATFSEGCSRLMAAAKFFPKVGEINEACRLVRAEEEREDASAIYSRKEWLPKTRAEMWMSHLRDTLTAMRLGLPRPNPPEPIDTEGPVFKCHHCQDTGFEVVCDCGQSSCKNCQYHYVKRCTCSARQRVVA